MKKESKEYWNAKDVAGHFKTSLSMVYYLHKRGRLPKMTFKGHWFADDIKGHLFARVGVWYSCKTFPCKNSKTVLLAVDLGLSPQGDELRGVALGHYSVRAKEWIVSGTVVQATHWSPLPEMPE